MFTECSQIAVHEEPICIARTSHEQRHIQTLLTEYYLAVHEWL